MSLISGTVNSVEGIYVTVLPFVEPGWATGKRGETKRRSKLLPDFFLLIEGSAQASTESDGGLSGVLFVRCTEHTVKHFPPWYG